jgi:hypothetical protein
LLLNPSHCEWDCSGLGKDWIDRQRPGGLSGSEPATVGIEEALHSGGRGSCRGISGFGRMQLHGGTVDPVEHILKHLRLQIDD